MPFDAMLCVRELSISFQKQTVLQDISFTLCEGETIAITGPSGCGKTTLLKAICGFVDIFDRGHITYKERLWQDATQKRLSPRLRPATLLFQESAVWPHLTVKQQIEIVTPKSQDNRNVKAVVSTEEIISDLGLAHRTNTLARHLSGGEKQRLALGRALKTTPEILLLDEPFNALDPVRKLETIELILRLKQKFNFKLAIATHEIEETKRFSASVLSLGQKGWFRPSINL